MQGDLITAALLPAGLMFIMFALGISLTVADFKRVFRYPRAFSVGVICHFILLPGAVYGVLMYASGIAFVFIIRRVIPPFTRSEAAAAQAALH